MKPFARWKTLRLVIPTVIVLLVGLILLGRRTESDFRKEIAEAEKAREWGEAEALWDRFAARYPASRTPDDLVRHARCELILDKPAKARGLLDAWMRTDRPGTEGWQLSIELRRALGDGDGVNLVMRDMLRSPEARRSAALLTVATFGILTAMNAEESQERLRRWAETEPESPMATVWLLARQFEEFDLGGGSGSGSFDEADKLAARWPSDPDVLRIYVESLFLRGDYEKVRLTMDRWPEDLRDSVAWSRLSGRRALEVDKDPGTAILHFRNVLAKIPHDWRTRYRLSRALSGAGQAEEARVEAKRTVEIRELLDPSGLEAKLKEAFPKGSQPVPSKLIELLTRIDQTELARAWSEWYEAEKLISKIR
jgi:hypothetical protein